MILNRLEAEGPAGRTALAELTGISRGALTGIIDQMIAEGTVVEVDPPDGSAPRAPGRPTRWIAFNGVPRITLAAQVAADFLRVALVDRGGNILRELVRNHLFASCDRDSTLSLIKELRSDLGFDDQPDRGVLAIPFGVDQDNQEVEVLVPTPTLKTWMVPGLQKAVSGALGVSSTIEYDANLSALAEFHEISRETRSFLKISVGHLGVGGGLILNGKLHRGSHGLAGGIAHLRVDGSDVICDCGLRGCLVAEIGDQVRGFYDARGGVNDVQQDLGARVRAGDPAARRLLADLGRTAGRVVASAVSLLDLDAVVVSDYLTQNPNDTLLADSVREGISENLLPAIREKLRVVSAVLQAGSPVRGAGLLPDTP